jgi:hypothetical protein
MVGTRSSGDTSGHRAALNKPYSARRLGNRSMGRSPARSRWGIFSVAFMDHVTNVPNFEFDKYQNLVTAAVGYE